MKKVLLLDDNEDAIILQTMILESNDFTVQSAKNGLEGLEKLRSFHPDIIISDVLMPEMDGFSFCRAVKSNEKFKNIPIVFYSAQYTDEEDKKLALDVGAIGFIYKPIEMAAFLLIVNRILEQEQQASHSDADPLPSFDQKHSELQAKMLDKKLRELELEHAKLQESEEKLRKINVHLTERIQEELIIIIEKEKILMQQSKMAAMGEMVSMIAHQWRQPLNSISAAAIKLNVQNALGTLSPEELTTTLKFIQEMTQKMSMTINDFMNFAQSGRKREIFLISDVVNDLSRMIKAQLTAYNIDFIIDIQQDINLNSYKQELTHALLNFLTNAKDAFDNKENSNKTITIRAYENDHFVSIEISDNGGGIDDSIINRIFEPFFTTKSTEKRSGLGLYMSKKIVEEHLQGSIKVMNKDNGALFKIELLK